MPFKPGESGNPEGKPKGAKNKMSIPLREKFTGFLEQKFDQFVKDYESLSAKDRTNSYCSLLPFVLPKLQNVTTDFEFEHLTDEQLNEIVLRLKKYALQEQELNEN